MKKLKLLLIAAFIIIQIACIKAQNLQVMYDFERGCVTSTVEMFRPDAGGSTYFFVDMDCAPKMVGAYWEIARELCFWQNLCPTRQLSGSCVCRVCPKNQLCQD